MVAAGAASQPACGGLPLRVRKALNRRSTSHARASEGSERSNAGAISNGTDASATCYCQPQAEPVVAVLRAYPAEPHALPVVACQ